MVEFLVIFAKSSGQDLLMSQILGGRSVCVSVCVYGERERERMCPGCLQGFWPEQLKGGSWH